MAAQRSQTALFPSDTAYGDAPSIFELLAQDQLRDLLHPVFRYVLTHYPRYFFRLVNRHEEVFALALLLVERHHLRKHNASLTDHFYHLRLAPASLPAPRLAARRGPARPGLARPQRWGMVLALVGLPYARARAQDLYERLGGRDGEDGGEAGGETSGDGALAARLGRPGRLYRAAYPYANLALDVALLTYDLGYLFGRTPYRPWHAWLGLRVVRRTDEPEPATGVLARLPPLLPPLLLALKAAQWWYSPASPRALPSAGRHSAHAAIVPPRPLPILPESGLLPDAEEPAPSPSEQQTLSDVESSVEVGGGASDIDSTRRTRHAGAARTDTAASAVPSPAGRAAGQAYVIEPDLYGMCPLCGRRWANPAVLPSGWVVCWRCGWDAITGADEGGGDDDEIGRDGGDSGGRARGLDGAGAAGEHGERKAQAACGAVRTRKGRCPFTGMRVRVDELRRVLI